MQNNSWNGYIAENLQGFEHGIVLNLEDESDVAFWNSVFEKYNAKRILLSFAYGGKERGKGQLMQRVLPNLNAHFLLCRDSDYDYLLYEDFERPFLFHTYSYSVENHKLCPQNLNILVANFLSQNRKEFFDFEIFILKISQIIFDLFYYHLYFLLTNQKDFQISEEKWYEIMNIPDSEQEKHLENHGEFYTSEIEKKAKKLVKKWQEKSKNIDFEVVKNLIDKHQINPKNAYLFVMGHPLYDNLLQLVKNLIKVWARHYYKTLDQERKAAYSNQTGIYKYWDKKDKESVKSIEEIDSKIEYKLFENDQKCLSYGNCSSYDKLEKDIRSFFE